jgi:S1-C subfamily serine protease
MSIPRKGDVIAKNQGKEGQVAAEFRAEVAKELQGFSGDEISVTISDGLSKKDLNAIIKECRKQGWKAKIFEERDGSSLILS